MRFEGIVDLYLRNGIVAPERSLHTVSNERDVEFIDAGERAFNRLTGWHGYGNDHRSRSWVARPAASTAPAATTSASSRDPEVLETSRIRDSGREPFQISVDRMATTALRFEVRLTGLRIADEDVQLNGRSCGRTALTPARSGNTVDEFGNSRCIRFWDVDSGHARTSTAPGNDRADELTVLIVQHELRPKQVGFTIISSAKVRTMATATVNTEQRLAPLDNRSIGQRALLSRKRVTSPP